MHQSSWEELVHHETCCIVGPISIDSSVWYATFYNKGESGMVQYDTISNRIGNIIKYEDHKPHGHQCCNYENYICIVDGKKGKLILFDTLTRQFVKAVTIPRIGNGASVIAMNDDIHIFNGCLNNNSKHIIYSVEADKIRILRCRKMKKKMNNKIRNQCVLRWGNKIIRFGGWNVKSKQLLDSFYISSPIKPNETGKIKWNFKAEYRLKNKHHRCGYVLYENFIMIFGGEIKKGQYSDGIYLLDLSKNIGWIPLKIKCPLKSQFFATLTANNDIHIFTGINQWPKWEESVLKHYSISISKLVSGGIDGGYNDHYNEMRHSLQILDLLDNQNKLKIENTALRDKINNLKTSGYILNETISEYNEEKYEDEYKNIDHNDAFSKHTESLSEWNVNTQRINEIVKYVENNNITEYVQNNEIDDDEKKLDEGEENNTLYEKYIFCLSLIQTQRERMENISNNNNVLQLLQKQKALNVEYLFYCIHTIYEFMKTYVFKYNGRIKSQNRNKY